MSHAIAFVFPAAARLTVALDALRNSLYMRSLKRSRNVTMVDREWNSSRSVHNRHGFVRDGHPEFMALELSVGFGLLADFP